MKNNTKKIVLIIACVVLSICIVLGALFLINHIGDCTLSLDRKTVLAGDNVELEITLDKNKGFYYGCITLEYDASAIEFVSYTRGDVFDECALNDIGGQVIMLVNQSDLTLSKENGMVARLKFRVKQNAKDGEYDIKFVEETNFCNIEDAENLIVPKFENGKITVK